jgi:hypothetical protein
MRDSQPFTEADSQKFWFTNESDSFHLYEYLNKTLFRAGTPSVTYKLKYAFKVTVDNISERCNYYHTCMWVMNLITCMV